LDELISVIKQGDVVVMRSTVPVGTGRQIIGDIEAKKNWSVGSDFYYVEAPERTVEGDALNEIKNLPQLLGGATKFCSEKVVEVFKDISSVVVPTSSIEVCELVKIAGNAFRDHLFAFSNHLAEEARRLNVDVNEVVEKSNLGYSRSTIPHPSPGVGGPCLTKDSYLFTSNYFVDSPARLSRLYNETVPMQVVDFIAASVPEPGSTTAAIFGLAFKGSPRTDDVRSSTNVQVAEALSKILKNVYLWDAVADLGNFGFGTKFEENDPPDTDLALILNNNPDNISVVKNLIYQSQKKTLLVFDPWLMLEPKHLFQNSALDELHYLTMSMKSTYRR
jgi:nucleotide sugar dehydrogenase